MRCLDMGLPAQQDLALSGLAPFFLFRNEALPTAQPIAGDLDNLPSRGPQEFCGIRSGIAPQSRAKCATGRRTREHRIDTEAAVSTISGVQSEGLLPRPVPVQIAVFQVVVVISTGPILAILFR